MRRLRVLAGVAALFAVTLAGPLTTGPTPAAGPAATAVVEVAEASTWAADRDAGTATITVVGDSISAGSPFCAWPNCWTTRVGWEWPTTNLARHGAQPGDLVPGGWCDRPCWYTEWGAAVMAEVAQRQPSAVIVALGAVSYGYIGQHPLDFAAAMRALVDDIRAVSPRSTIVLVHTPGYVASHGQYWIWVDYGRALDAIVQETPNSAYIDEARDLPWANTDTSGAFTADHVHPGQSGHVMMAVAIIVRLRWLP